MDKKRAITIIVDAQTERLLESAALNKGVSVTQFCSDAVVKELNVETSYPKFSVEEIIETSDQTMPGRRSFIDPVDLDQLFAECDAITQGRISATDSADLIREAREERHLDMERNGSP